MSGRSNNDRWSIAAVALTVLTIAVIIGFFAKKWTLSLLYPFLLVVIVLTLTITALFRHRAPLNFLAFLLMLIFFLFLTGYNGTNTLGNEFNLGLLLTWLVAFGVLITTLISSWGAGSAYWDSGVQGLN